MLSSDQINLGNHNFHPLQLPGRHSQIKITANIAKRIDQPTLKKGNNKPNLFCTNVRIFAKGNQFPLNLFMIVINYAFLWTFFIFLSFIHKLATHFEQNRPTQRFIACPNSHPWSSASKMYVNKNPKIELPRETLFFVFCKYVTKLRKKLKYQKQIPVTGRTTEATKKNAERVTTKWFLISPSVSQAKEAKRN